MRIIDKNTDFYDYLQNVYLDNSVTFDRTDSFVLTKDMIKSYLRYFPYNYYYLEYFILLQVCNTFWLFHINIKPDSIDKFSINDYSLDFMDMWKNYNKDRKLIQLAIISFPYYFKNNEFKQFVNNGQYKTHKVINKHIIYKDDGKNVEKHIPILKACGIGSLIDPLDIYLAIEEYFSLEKQDSERTESVGLTDNEKIENHGFDTKISFRGK